jgi:hypothetical protein
MNYHIFIGHNFTTAQLITAAVVLAALFLVALGAFLQRHRERNPALHDRVESEYDQVFLGISSAYLLGGKLVNRVSPNQAVKIRELCASEREWVVTEWQAIQSSFVDHPRTSLIEADDLINALLETRGSLEATLEQCEAGVSVDDQPVVENFGVAHSVAVRFGQVEPTAEELRTAMMRYREIFDYLLQTPKRPETESPHRSELGARMDPTSARAV